MMFVFCIELSVAMKTIPWLIGSFSISCNNIMGLENNMDNGVEGKQPCGDGMVSL